MASVGVMTAVVQSIFENFDKDVSVFTVTFCFFFFFSMHSRDLGFYLKINLLLQKGCVNLKNESVGVPEGKVRKAVLTLPTSGKCQPRALGLGVRGLILFAHQL